MTDQSKDISINLKAKNEASEEIRKVVSDANQMNDKLKASNKDQAEQIKKLTQENKNLKREQEKVTKQQEKLNAAKQKGTGTLGKLTSGIQSYVTGWLSFTAIVGLVVAGLRAIMDAANKAKDAMVELGEAHRGLAANIGGRRAEALQGDLTRIAYDESLGVKGRSELMRFATDLTTNNSELSNQQIVQRTRQFGKLHRATGLDASTAETLTRNYAGAGVKFNDAIDRIAVLENSGITTRVQQNILKRAGNQGGNELLDLLYASRQDIDLEAASEQMETLMNALGRTDQQGRLDPRLMRLGINKDQTMVQRIGTLSQANLTQAQARSITGTSGGTELLMRLMGNVGNLSTAQAEIAAGGVQNEIKKITDGNTYIQFQERERDRELRAQVARETEEAADLGETVSEYTTGLAEQGDGDSVLGGFRRYTGVNWGGEGALGDLGKQVLDIASYKHLRSNDTPIHRLSNDIRSMAFGSDSQPVQVNNITNQYVNGDPANATVDRRAGR